MNSRSKKIKFVIVGFRGRNGGSIALHTLCSELKKKGYSCKIFYPEAVRMPRESIVYFWIKSIYHHIKFIFKKLIIKRHDNDDCSTVTGGWIKCFLSLLGRNCIVIYPERFAGNILGAKNVVRWFLYQPSADLIESFGSNELFFAYREIFNVPELNPECRMLEVCSFNRKLFKQTNFGERSGCCYILRKGRNRPDIPKIFDGPVIDSWSFDEQVKALNQYKYCITYDTQTAYTTIAVMCGCIPIVMLEKGKNKSDYLKGNDADYGVAYGDSAAEIERAILTRDQRINCVIEIEKENEVYVENFVQECITYFGLK